MAIATCVILSCKKEVSNRITNVTYELDSVKIENLGANDSVTSYFTIPIGEAFYDTIMSQNGYPSSDGSGFYSDNDSLIFLNHPEFFDLTRAVVYNKTLVYYQKFYPYGSFAQDGFDKRDVSYHYDISNRLSTIQSVVKHHNAVPNFTDSDFVYKSRLTFNYTNNNLTTISEDFIRYNFHSYDLGYDSIIQPTNNSAGTFFYDSNYENQKDMISIDLNDLVFNSIIGASYYDDLYFGHLISILNNRLSYHTRSTSLLERFNFKTYFGSQNNYTGDIEYTFEASKNNRVKTMKISSDLLGKTSYTFYYKD